ncbi:hypothetical protein [Aureispira anguillae]|nr:hypothetical protein [Aureispira anguillae]
MRCFFIFFCFCCALLPSHLYAQGKIELFNNLEQIGAFKSLHKTFDLKTGEDLIVTVTPMKGVLGKLVIDIPESQFQYVNKKIKKLDRALIRVTKSGTYAFHFVNNDISKKELDIKIYKQRSTVDKDTVILDDIIFSSFRDTVKTYKDDTIPVPDLAEYEFVLSPALNYGAVSDSLIFEELLKDENTEYQYAAYWVGIGTEALAAYEKLKNNPPPSWRIAGINEPLMAYGLGVTELLPHSSSSIARDVMFKFMNPEKYNNTNKKPRLTRKDKRADFFGRIPISSASKYRELLLSIRNFNTTTGVPVYVKFAKFKLQRVYRNEYIIRERVQEIFREKTMQVLAPEEG